jgi:chromosome segregation ATPase
MITLKQESALLKKLKSLTELELEALVAELKPHIDGSRMHHVFRPLSCDEDTDELNEQIDSLTNELSDMESDWDDYRCRCEDAKHALDNLEIYDDDLQKEIDKISEML